MAENFDTIWAPGHETAPQVEFPPNQVIIHDLRDFEYKSESDSIHAYKTVAIPIESVRSVKLLVVPFDFLPGGAHVFVSFEFDSIEPIAVSFEARRRIGQTYSPVKGLFNIYPFLAVIGTEQDLVSLREDVRKTPVHKYPLKLSPKESQEFFLKILQEAQKINSIPDSKLNTKNFKQPSYNTIFNNCVTATVSALNATRPKKIKYGLRTVFSAYLPAVFRSHELID